MVVGSLDSLQKGTLIDLLLRSEKRRKILLFSKKGQRILKKSQASGFFLHRSSSSAETAD
jgi:hypothetical protein